MKSHLKRLTVPKTWQITKKSDKFVTRPFPSRSFEHSMPLSVIFRDMLKVAGTAKEVKLLLSNNYIFVDGKRKTDIKQTMGLMDTLEIKGTNEAYRMLLNKKGKLVLVPIKEAEARLRPSKIVGKTTLTKARTQINLLGGYNVTVPKDDFKVGDTVMLSMPDKKIVKSIPMKEGSVAYLIAGSHVGRSGKILSLTDKEIVIKAGEGEIRTSKMYAFAIGEEKPAITLSVD